jgi:hypothetical protein
MKKLTVLVSVAVFLSTAATVNAQTVTPAATPTSTDIAGSAVAAAAVIIVFAFIIYAGYRIIKKWSGPSRGESES